MRPVVVRISAVSLVILMLVSCIATAPSSSADDAEYGEYGATYGFDYMNFDDAVKTATGKSVSEWISFVFSEVGGYDVETTPDVYAKFTNTRDTVQKDGVYTINDHVSGYLNAGLEMTAIGSFPIAGTYERNEGESTLQFIHRVFNDESGGARSDIGLFSWLEIYLDMDLVSHVDLETGNVTDSYLTVKFAIYEQTDRTISLDYTSDDDGNIMTITIGYDRVKTNNNFFMDTEVAFTIEDMPVFVGDDSWTMRPKVTEHVNKLVLSSDLANSIWLKAIDMSDGDKDKSKLPQLILKLLGSGGRMLDLFDTIRSLTGSSMSDITFLDVFDATQYTDYNGYKYTKITPVREGGQAHNLPRAAYTMRYGDLVATLPDYIMKNTVKVALALFFVTIGWNDIDVCDISNDPDTKAECNEIREYVNGMIKEDNIESYSVPAVYAGVAAGGITISIIILLLIWRRII